MKLPGTPGQLRGRPVRSGPVGVSRGAHFSNGVEVGGRIRSRFTQISAALAVAAMVLMGSAPAMAEGEPPSAPPATAPSETAPPAESPPADVPAGETPPAPVPTVAPAPAAPPAAPVADAPASPEPLANPDETPAEASPEASAVEEPAPPYLRLRVTDTDDSLIGAVTVAIHGPRNTAVADDGADSQWVGVMAAKVTDNIGQPGYAGADLDPDPGMLLVKTLVDETDPAVTHDVAAAESYRARPSLTPDGFVTGEAASWLEINSAGTANDPISNMVLLPTEPQTPVLEEEPAVRAAEELVTPFGVVATDCGTTSNCAGLRMTNTVVGGTATAADWALKAVRNNASLDEYDFTSGQTRTVPRNVGGFARAVYTLSATATPAIQALYETTFACTKQEPSNHSNNTTNIDVDDRTVAFGYRDNNNQGSPADRYAYCTFTHTLVSPATIIVKTGGDRTGTTGVTNLAGVVLYLNTGANSPSGTRADGVAGDAPGWARCVSDVNGECKFLVPSTGSGGTNRDSRFWVVQPATGVPTGWYTNPNLRTGDGSGDGSSNRYAFRTGSQLRAGQTYLSTSSDSFMRDTGTSATKSSGVWAQSRENRAFPQSCGLNIALVLDVSGSMAGSMDNLKTASDTFVNAMVGTQSSMALFSFSSSSPGNSTQNYPALTSVATQPQADAFKARYSGWNANGGTNWDRGLAVPAAASANVNKYDIAVVITDGNPTYYGTGPSGNGSDTRFIEVENGIFSANALKAAGTRVLAFGVGAGVTGTNTALNLRAISGPTKYNGSNGATADYLQTTDYDALGATLRQLALGNCAGQLTVTKMVVPNTAPAGSIAGAAPGVAGWEFTASDPGAGLTLPAPPVRTTIADNTGTVSFPLSFAGGTASAEVTVTEAQQAGYTLVPVAGNNAVCRNLTTQQNVPLTGNPVDGFRVSVPSTQTINCTVYNRAPNLTATVAATKKWVVKDGQGNESTYQIPGDEGLLPDGLAAQLTLTGPAAAGATNQAWGAVRPNYASGNSVTINETATIDPQKLPGCTLTSKIVSQKNGAGISQPVPFTTELIPGPNTFELTNTVTCLTKLTLVKSLTNDNGGTSDLSDWILTAEGPTAGLTGATGNPLITGAAVIPGAYALSESGPLGYASAGWTCSSAGGDVPVTAGSVAVALGANVTCTVQNNDKPGAVSWTKVAKGTTTLLEGSEWKIVGTSPAVPAVEFEDCVVSPCGGLDKDPTAGKFALQDLSWGSYTVTEVTAPPGYIGGATFTFAVNGGNAGTVIVHGAVENEQQPGVALPLTGGMSSEMYSLAGSGIAALAALLGVAYWRRFRRPAEVA